MAETRNSRITSSMHSASISTGSGLALANLAGDEDLKKTLECPVCLEIAIPPIYTCQTGHIICEECKSKLIECVLCKSPYTNSRNFPLESLVRSSKFFCKFRAEGCNVSASIDELSMHHDVCLLRPLKSWKCHLGNSIGCSGAPLDMSEYVRHLTDCHKLEILERKSASFDVSYRCPVEHWKGDLHKLAWNATLLKFEGNVFVPRICKYGPLFYFGFYFIGKKSVIAKFNVKMRVQVQSTSDRSVCVFKNSVTIPVVSIEDLHSDDKNKDKTCVVMHRDFLDKIGFITRSDGATSSHFCWDVNYRIKNLSIAV